MSDWLSEIEVLSKYCTVVTVAEQQRMARVLREQSKIAKVMTMIDWEVLIDMEDDPETRQRLIQLWNLSSILSDDAKELLHDNKEYQAGGE